MRAPAVRRRELIDIAQRLFLAQGYEQTSINEVILAAGLSKGAFYHHFRSKEDLLEAIVARFAEQSLGFIAYLDAGEPLDALSRLNRLLALGREWKREHLGELQAMFTTLLRPENVVLYHRIIGAALEVLRPALARVIADGVSEGVFAPVDPPVAAEAMLALSEGRRPLVIEALAVASTDPQAALARIMHRVRAEETLIDRMLGLAPGAVQIAGSQKAMEDLLLAWRAGEA